MNNNKELFGLWILSVDCTNRKIKSNRDPNIDCVWQCNEKKKEKKGKKKELFESGASGMWLQKV